MSLKVCGDFRSCHLHKQHIWSKLSLLRIYSSSLPSNRQHLSCVDCLEDMSKDYQNCSVPYTHMNSSYMFAGWGSGFRMLFTTLHGMQTRSSDENSVRPSVRLSVTRVYRDKTVERCLHHTKEHFTLYERTFSLVFWEEEWLVRGDPFYLKFWVNRPPLERNRRFSTNNRS